MRQICPTNSHAAFDTGTKGRTDGRTDGRTWELRGILAFCRRLLLHNRRLGVGGSARVRARICAGRSRSLGKALLRQASDEEGNEQNMNGTTRI